MARAHRPADGLRRLGGARGLRPSASRALDHALRGAVAEAAEHARRSRSTAAARYGFPAGFLARYFEKLRYRFGERERAGLARFYEMAAARGALEAAPDAALRRRRSPY